MPSVNSLEGGSGAIRSAKNGEDNQVVNMNEERIQVLWICKRYDFFPGLCGPASWTVLGKIDLR